MSYSMRNALRTHCMNNRVFTYVKNSWFNIKIVERKHTNEYFACEFLSGEKNLNVGQILMLCNRFKKTNKKTRKKEIIKIMSVTWDREKGEFEQITESLSLFY